MRMKRRQSFKNPLKKNFTAAACELDWGQRTVKHESTMDLHHPILREFPEHRDTIKRLKGTDEHFRKMFDEYHRLDDAIYRIEEEIDFATDQEIDELKMRRTKLKDYIYHLVRHAPAACPACNGTGVAQ